FGIITQNAMNMRGRGNDLFNTVLNNTNFQIFCGGKESAANKYIIDTSGQVVETMRGWNGEGEVTYREVMMPGVTPEMLNLVNLDPELSIVSITPGCGWARFKRPFLMRTPFAISKQEWDRQMAAELPLLPVNSSPPTTKNPPESPCGSWTR